ncbi:heterokaryon incompatibility protein-domain-containing protein [Colletotrichum phormii]|uniref:Heterokaryon incompatibility protein-domain-containing protein n=1 Tax=Colletotrichum phormii TaxID=359342 RepID=A0AAI9ZZZ1_9PEZI|nr:heterokaryon incompatibility protein-domain-containing protein [Colletotrichum phormii]KAK1641360.1 heterokaryon incompatibility protein-domain-containing protein [Colletotrichum phormii]
METHNPYKELSRGDSPQIRLLRIESAKNNDDVMKLNLYTKSLDKSPRFKALSYAWGDEKHTMPILLNGFPFGVTYNLHAALKVLRSKPNKGFLWVDAICVNQRDTSEKGHQISLMGLNLASLGLPFITSSRHGQVTGTLNNITNALTTQKHYSPAPVDGLRRQTI